jgi:hypothetical protein
VSPSESFQEYLVDVNGIFFNTWDIGDVEEYFAMCHG